MNLFNPAFPRVYLELDGDKSTKWKHKNLMRSSTGTTGIFIKSEERCAYSVNQEILIS